MSWADGLYGQIGVFKGYLSLYLYVYFNKAYLWPIIVNISKQIKYLQRLYIAKKN